MSRFVNPTALTTPCDNCPFRKSLPGFLRKERAAQIAESIKRGEEFPCHKTIDYDEGGKYTEKTQYCAGSLILMEKTDTARNNTWLEVSQRMGYGYDPAKLDMSAPVYDTYEEFINAQE